MMPTKGKAQIEALATLGKSQVYLQREIRRPLAIINLLGRAVLKRGKLEDEDREAMDAIIEQASACEALLRDSLYLVGPMTGKRKLVDAAGLLRSIRRTLKKEGVTVRLQSDKKVKPVVSCVLRRLQQALLNVARNLVEAMHEPGPLTLRCHTTETGVIISIEDTGAGIKPEAAKRLFEPSFSSDKAGMSLSLALAKKIIQDHDGSITVRAKPQGTTTVAIRLPRHVPKAQRK